jgi:hypothetical protein
MDEPRYDAAGSGRARTVERLLGEGGTIDGHKVPFRGTIASGRDVLRGESTCYGALGGRAGRAGRLTALLGGFRPGQSEAKGVAIHTAAARGYVGVVAVPPPGRPAGSTFSKFGTLLFKSTPTAIRPQFERLGSNCARRPQILNDSRGGWWSPSPSVHLFRIYIRHPRSCWRWARPRRSRPRTNSASPRSVSPRAAP